MRQTIILGAGLAGFFIGLSGPVAAADPALPPGRTPTAQAEVCLNDLKTFNTQMQTDGYWLGGSGYGYPVWGFAYGEGLMPDRSAARNAANYTSARAGYEIRTLLAAATVQAQHGQQVPCEATLTSARGIYAPYAERLHDAAFARADNQGWQKQQIASAVPISGSAASYRSDQLLDTDVRDAANEALGSIHDLIINPATGRIAYMVVARGGIFGLGEHFVPVPWESFKVATNLSLLVLDASKAMMDAAPTIRRDQFGEAGQFAPLSEQVDSYWRAHPTGR